MTFQEFVAEACKDLQNGAVVYNSYSGRSMYSRQCFGLAGSLDECMEVLKAVVSMAHSSDDFDGDFEELLDYAFGFERDSMGCGVILYWPSLEPIENYEPE